MVDKNQAVIDYLITCPTILNSPLYFNMVNAKDSSNQFVTETNDQYANRTYVDGSVLRVYTFTIITFKSAADNAVVKQAGFQNENIDDLSSVQALIDWVKEQEELRNYPNFGSNCEIDEILPTTDNPSFNGIDEEVSPPLAVYSTSIQIRYIDKSKCVWR